MTPDERSMVNWFKGELKSYLNSKAMLKSLDEKIRELDNRLAYHSPDMSGEPHGSAAPHDQQLANYITLRDRFMKQYEALTHRSDAVELILSAIPEEDRRIIIRVSKGLTTMESEGRRTYRTKNEIQNLIDRQILKAVKDHMGLNDKM